jgi:hypothetical protein
MTKHGNSHRSANRFICHFKPLCQCFMYFILSNTLRMEKSYLFPCNTFPTAEHTTHLSHNTFRTESTTQIILAPQIDQISHCASVYVSDLRLVKEPSNYVDVGLFGYM